MSVITNALALGAWISTATGHPAFGAIIADPSTANAITLFAGVVLSGIAAFSPSVVKPQIQINDEIRKSMNG